MKKETQGKTGTPNLSTAQLIQKLREDRDSVEHRTQRKDEFYVGYQQGIQRAIGIVRTVELKERLARGHVFEDGSSIHDDGWICEGDSSSEDSD